MKRLFWGIASVWILLTVCMLHAASLDGTSSLVYKSNLQTFRNGLNEYVRGFVRLDNGFAIGPSASAFMDTNISVSGPLDFGETGMLVLLNSMYTDGPITLTSSGNIKGKPTVSGDAKTIFLGGDLTLSATTYARVLHITGDWSKSGTSGDLIIDGQGHTLIIGDRAQIFVDTNVTLTLRNMTIMTGAKSLMVPPIRLASNGSKLTLDNVMFDLGADFQFMQGQIFIHNEVAVTGTSAFVYRSPRPSYITSGATWSFEQGTTFSVAPSTYTDCPYTVNSTYTNNNFIVLADQSSALSLNSCSFKTTYTGLRITKGMLMFDNRVDIDTMAGLDLANTTTTPVGYVVGAATGGGPRFVTWSPDGRFIAMANQSGSTLQVFRFNGSTTLTSLATPSTGIGSQPVWVGWSPDGRFLAEINLGGTLQVYRFNGSSSPTIVGGAVATASQPYGAAWSPDGKFIAVVHIGANILQVYRFDGYSSPVSLGTVSTVAGAHANVAWSPDGRLLAVTNSDGANSVTLFRFNGLSVPTSLGSVATGAGTLPYAGTWSPDGRFLALMNSGSSTMQIYRTYGSGLPVAVGTTPPPTGSSPLCVTWSPDGRFLAVVSYSSNILQIYRFDGVNEPYALGPAIATGLTPRDVSWSPDGKFLAVVNDSRNTLQIYRCNYYFTGQPAQSFTNGLVFGQSALGSGYNVDVNVAGSARVEINGKVSDDSA